MTETMSIEEAIIFIQNERNCSRKQAIKLVEQFLRERPGVATGINTETGQRTVLKGTDYIVHNDGSVDVV